MWYIVGSLLVLGLCAALANRWEERKRRWKSSESDGALPETETAGCCGRHTRCERLPMSVDERAVYYDDEELDAYRGTASDAYPETATDAFRDVLYTMRETEIAGWLQSLRQRGLQLPDALKDEVLLIVGEQRFGQM